MPINKIFQTLCVVFAVLSVSLYSQTTHTVTNTNDSGAGSLRAQMAASVAGDTVDFNVSGTITLASELPEVQAFMTITGAGQSVIIDGNSLYRPFFLNGSNTTISNLTLQNCRAKGGNGGSGGAGGGGGGGLGGAVFVGSSGALTLSNMTFSSNSAIGGTGGAGSLTLPSGGGGGGGLGGNGGSSSGNRGGGGGGGQFVGNNGSNASGSTGASGSSPGANGGNAGVAGSNASAFGGGGGGGGEDLSMNGRGGNGGYGGGGAGGGGGSSGGDVGGDGNFGGGGGGGGATSSCGAGGTFGGTGGNGGVTGGGGGGGGAGIGGNIFVRTGGTLTIDSEIPAGTVTAGAGGNGGGSGQPGTAGQALGSGFYMQTGTATFSTTGTETVSGVIAGAAGFTKTGTGTVTLSATNTYTGATTVSAGTLSVTGSIVTSSGVTVASGATLKGTGTVPATTVNGIMQPGTSIGTTTVTGNYIQAANSTLTIEFSPTATSLVDISGTATVSGTGTTLRLLPQAGTYTAGTTHTFLDADGGLTGTYVTETTVSSGNLNGATFQIQYTANAGQILFLTSSSGSGGGASPLSGDTAMLGITSDLATRINRSQMGLITEVQNQRFLQRKICCRFPAKCHERYKGKNKKSFLNRNKKPKKACDAQELYHPYLMVDYSRADVRRRKHMLPGKDYLRALITGCDFYFTKDFVAGGSVGYTNGDASSSGGFGHMTSNGFNLGAYFQARAKGNIFVDGAFSWGKNYYESKRSISGFNSAKYHGYDLASQLRILYQSYFTKVNYRPYISGTYYLQQTGNYTERRDDTNRLKVGKDHYDFFELEFGLAFWAPFEVRCWTIAPQLSFAYVRDYLRKPHDIKATFISNFNGNQSVRVANVTDKQWKIQAGLSAHYLHCTEIFFTYEALFDRAYDNFQEYRLGVQRGF